MNCGFEDCLILDELLDKHGDEFGPVLEEFSRIRPPACHALAELSLHNFVEMRDHTASKFFLFKRRVDAVSSFFPPHPSRDGTRSDLTRRARYSSGRNSDLASDSERQMDPAVRDGLLHPHSLSRRKTKSRTSGAHLEWRRRGNGRTLVRHIGPAVHAAEVKSSRELNKVAASLASLTLRSFSLSDPPELDNKNRHQYQLLFFIFQPRPSE